jgi:NADH-quinone oxidoreductase subunit N
MDLTTLQAIAAHNDWMAIFPELLLGCVALALLVLEIVLPAKYHSFLPGFALFGVLAILPSQLLSFRIGYIDGDSFNGLLHHSHEGQIMRVFFLLAATLVCLLGTVSLAKQKVPQTEFYHIVLVVTAALMLLAQSNHFVMLFVALETVTIGLYILVRK